MPQAYAITEMTRENLGTAVDWAAAEGWNPGLEDRDTFFDTDPKGFFMGFLDKQPVASISLVKYGGGFGFLGFYIVAPQFRGKGFGLSLWNHAMASAKGLNVGLDGVVDQQDNYKKSGFKLAFRNIRFQGETIPALPSAGSLLPLDRVAQEDLAAFDARFSPVDRTGFITAWAGQKGSRGLALISDGRLEGYGIIRPCRQGYKIGPLFALHPEGGEHLFTGLAALATAGEPVFLDVPEPNRAAVAMAGKYGMVPCFETARMYTGPFPDLPLDRIFGITSFELG